MIYRIVCLEFGPKKQQGFKMKQSYQEGLVSLAAILHSVSHLLLRKRLTYLCSICEINSTHPHHFNAGQVSA